MNLVFTGGHEKTNFLILAGTRIYQIWCDCCLILLLFLPQSYLVCSTSCQRQKIGFFMPQYKFSLYSSVDFSLKAALMVANAWIFPTGGSVIHLSYCTAEIFYVWATTIKTKCLYHDKTHFLTYLWNKVAREAWYMELNFKSQQKWSFYFSRLLTLSEVRDW